MKIMHYKLMVLAITSLMFQTSWCMKKNKLELDAKLLDSWYIVEEDYDGSNSSEQRIPVTTILEEHFLGNGETPHLVAVIEKSDTNAEENAETSSTILAEHTAQPEIILNEKEAIAFEKVIQEKWYNRRPVQLATIWGASACISLGLIIHAIKK